MSDDNWKKQASRADAARSLAWRAHTSHTQARTAATDQAIARAGLHSAQRPSVKIRYSLPAWTEQLTRSAAPSKGAVSDSDCRFDAPGFMMRGPYRVR